MNFKEEPAPIIASKSEPKIHCTHSDLTRGMNKALRNDRSRLSSADFLTVLTNLVGSVSTYNSNDFNFYGINRQAVLVIWVVIICLTAIPIVSKLFVAIYSWNFPKDDINDRVEDLIGEIANHDPASQILKAAASDRRRRMSEHWLRALLKSMRKKTGSRGPAEKNEPRSKKDKRLDQHAS